MPIILYPPKIGKTPYWTARGHYFGIRVDRTTKAVSKADAKRVIRKWQDEIKRGVFARPSEPTFASAALSYIKAGGDDRYLSPLVEHFQNTTLKSIDQAAIDDAAVKLYPNHTAATRNRMAYTPASAVLKHAGIERPLKRPKGWRGKKSTTWLEPHQAFRLFEAADAIEAEFGLLCRFLCYTGLRLSEAIQRPLSDLKLDRAFLYLPDSKNGEPRGCHLPPIVVDAFQKQPPRARRIIMPKGKRSFAKGEGGGMVEDIGVPFLERDPGRKLFRYYKGSFLYGLLAQAMADAELIFPRRQRGFHIFCHTYGSWMHRFGKLDTYGLTRTGRWADPSSADRYVHTEASEEARRADLLPTPSGAEKVRKTKKSRTSR